MDRVLVYTAKNEIDARLVEGYLQNAGMRVFILKDLGSRAADYMGYNGSANFIPWGIYVAAEQEAEAHALLDERPKGNI